MLFLRIYDSYIIVGHNVPTSCFNPYIIKTQVRLLAVVAVKVLSINVLQVQYHYDQWTGASTR